MAFTAERVQQILQRAAEVEQDEARTAHSPSLSADELRAAATAAGFSEEALDRALHEFETSVPEQAAAPVPHFRTDLLPVQLDKNVEDAFVRQLRTQFGGIGTIYEIGNAFEWHGEYNGQMVLCSVRPEGNQTRVSLQLGDKRILPRTRDVWLTALLIPLLVSLMLVGVLGVSSMMLIFTLMTIACGFGIGVLGGGAYLHDRIALGKTQAALDTAFGEFNRAAALIQSARDV
ncbi:MAG: hypothetical protein AAGJ10_05610 [Bacteroidota bacterium]